MPPLDSVFTQKRPPYQHPLLRFLDGIKPEDVRVEVVRPKDVLGYKPASIYLHWVVGGAKQPPHPYPWDSELNEALVRLGIRSPSADAEKVRFGLALRDSFKRPEARFGDGFFNAVLVMVVRELEFQEYPEVAEVLRHVTQSRPHMGGHGYDDCREMIIATISGLAGDLVDKLHYSEADAKTILAGAMARFLDERFTVSDRIRLGWATS